MKYDILVQTFTGSNWFAFFSPKVDNFFSPKSVSGYYKTKKKVAWTTKPLV